MIIEVESAKRNTTLPAVPFRWALLFAALLFSGRLAFSALIRDQELLTTVSNLYMFVEGLAAVASAYYTSRYLASHSRQLSKTWTFLAFGMLSILIGNLIWTAISLIYKEFPTPSIADLFFVLFYGLTWLGLYNYPLSPQRGGEYKYIWLDNIIVILGSGLLFWVLVISPILKANWGDFSQLTISMAYPIFDLLLLCSLLTFFRNRPEQSTYPPLLLIGLGLTIELAADSFFTYQEMLGTYTGGNFIDLIWSVSFMFCFLAGFAQVSAQNHLPKPIQETRTAQITRQTWPVYLPYFWLVVACALIINSGASPAQQPEDYITVGLIILLVVIRQLLTLRENENLVFMAQIELDERILAQEALHQAHAGLEERVRKRTADLQEANQALQIQISERERAEQALRYRAEMDKMLASISTKFINTSAAEIDPEINRTLALLGSFAGADRCYLTQVTSGGSAFSTTYEWCAPGVQSYSQTLQNIPAASTPWWTERLRRFEVIHIPDVGQMPVEANIEKTILQNQGIQSFVVVPLVSEYALIGFMGFDAVREKKEFLADEVILLKTIAEVFTNALSRSLLQLRLQEHVRQVEESLEEKNVLLKEIHHRVKNNLQVISSLLSLQSAQIKDPHTVQLFRDSQNRVRSMALIHEKLYQSYDLARIDFKGYVQSLSSYLVRSFAAEARGVTFRIEVEDISLGIDQAIPCGLIINELVSNALKYAFPEDREGEVYIRFFRDKDQQFHLHVGDNGIDFPEQIDFQNTTSLGLQLVNSLVSQLGGYLELIKTGGVEFCITFCEPEEE